MVHILVAMVTWQFHLMPQNCQQVPKDCNPINNHLLETNKIWIFFLKQSVFPIMCVFESYVKFQVRTKEFF